MISRLPNTLKGAMTNPRQESANTHQQSSNSYINAIIEVKCFVTMQW